MARIDFDFIFCPIIPSSLHDAVCQVCFYVVKSCVAVGSLMWFSDEATDSCMFSDIFDVCVCLSVCTLACYKCVPMLSYNSDLFGFMCLIVDIMN